MTSTAPATAAGAALLAVRERRAIRREGRGKPAQSGPSPIASAVSGLASVFDGLRKQAGVSTWVVVASACGMVAAGVMVVLGPWLLQVGPPCPVHAVVGHVAVGKTIPAGAQLVFHPVNGELPDMAVPRATVKDDGSFTVSTFGAHDGAPEGEYIVTIQWFRMSKDGAPGPNVLPRTYSAPASSPLRVAVQPGRNQLEPLVIAR